MTPTDVTGPPQAGAGAPYCWRGKSRSRRRGRSAESCRRRTGSCSSRRKASVMTEWWIWAQSPAPRYPPAEQALGSVPQRGVRPPAPPAARPPAALHRRTSDPASAARRLPARLGTPCPARPHATRSPTAPASPPGAARRHLAHVGRRRRRAGAWSSDHAGDGEAGEGLKFSHTGINQVRTSISFTIIFFRAAASPAHASITRSSMSSSVICCRPRGADAFLDAFDFAFSESPVFTERFFTPRLGRRSGGCGFESRRAR
jgi:hypothetical protein